jgi:putative ABC transport system substrate-binding protein
VKRREFITLLGSAAAAWPLAARAQQATKLPTIGYLGPGSAAAWGPWTDAFVQRLSELGWIEARTVAIEYRWADGRFERFKEIALEFVQRNVDVIVTGQSALPTVQQATSVIPVVFALGNDPLESGFVTSLARPGGNITGLSTQAGDLVSKRIELLRGVLPNLKRLAVLGNVGQADSVREMADVELTATRLDIQVVRAEIRTAKDIGPIFEKLTGADAIYVCSGPLTNTYRVRINTLAQGARLPTVHLQKQYLEGGGLMAYGPSYPALFRRAADYVDKILRGAHPGDLPVEQPTKFELVIDLNAAKLLGLTIPPTLLARADEVIE